MKSRTEGDASRRRHHRHNNNNKVVRFDLERNTERLFVVPNDIPHEDLWFTAAEFDEIKQTSRTESREWRKVYSHLLNETFEEPRVDAQDYLIAFCLMQGEDLYRRGLERQCNRHHGEQRSDAKDRARFLVFETQRRLKLAAMTRTKKKKEKNNKASPASSSTCNITGTSIIGGAADKISVSFTRKTTTTSTTSFPAVVLDDDDDDDDDEQQLADMYMESCRFAKLFAHRIAKADEIVAMSKMMDCAARTQVLVTPRFKRRSSGMSVQSNDSLDSRMLLLHQYQGRNQHQQRPLQQPYPLPTSPHNNSSSSYNSTIRRGSATGGSTAPFKSWSQQQQQHRHRTTSPTTPTLSLGRASGSLSSHHEAYAAIA